MKVICNVISPKTIDEMIKANGGITIKNYKMVSYESGWQVADYGFVVKTIEECYKIVRYFNFTDCGIWYSEEQGGYCVDHSFRVNTKKVACEIGSNHNQESVLKWSDMSYYNMKGEKIYY